MDYTGDDGYYEPSEEEMKEIREVYESECNKKRVTRRLRYGKWIRWLKANGIRW